MKAPACDQAATAAAAPASSDLAGASRPGPSTSDGRAPLRWPFTSRAQQERALKRRSDEQRNLFCSGLSSESDGEEKNSNGMRETDEAVDSESGESKSSSPLPSQTGQPAAKDEVLDETEAVISKEWVAARFASVFVVGASGPAASEQKDKVRTVTTRLAKLAWAHLQGRCREPLRQCYVCRSAACQCGRPVWSQGLILGVLSMPNPILVDV